MASLEVIDQRLQQNSLETKITNSLIAGKALKGEGNSIKVFMDNDIIVELLSINSGNRTPSMGNHLFSVYNGKVSLNISATLDLGDSGKVWNKILEQSKEL